jgi:hypothetical protein
MATVNDSKLTWINKTLDTLIAKEIIQPEDRYQVNKILSEFFTAVTNDYNYEKDLGFLHELIEYNSEKVYLEEIELKCKTFTKDAKRFGKFIKDEEISEACRIVVLNIYNELGNQYMINLLKYFSDIEKILNYIYSRVHLKLLNKALEYNKQFAREHR